MIEVDQTYKLIFNINNAHKIAIDGTLLKTLKNDDKSIYQKIVQIARLIQQ